jgi:O-antigen/teichoic acid export membrane protein
MGRWLNIGRFTRSEIVRNSTKLLTANVVAQVVGLLVYPILTRLYSPDDFGLLNLFLSIGGVLVLLATADYQYAIVLPKEDDKARAVFQVGAFTTICVSVLCLLAIPFSTPIATLFNAPNLANWLWLMPFFVLIYALWTLLNYWYTRRKNFGQISAYQVTQSSLGALSKIGFGVTGATSSGLIVSSIIAPFVALVANICINFKQKLADLLHIDRNACRIVAREYANFPKFSLPRALVNNLSSNLPSLLLTPFFGLANLGFWGMGITLAFRPLNIISASIYQVMFEHITERVNQRQSIAHFLRKFLRLSALIFIPCFAALYFILPWLTSWLLGADWEITGHYIRWMLPWLTMSMLVAPICFLSDIFSKQKIGLLLEILLVCARLAGMLVGIVTNNFYNAIIGYSLGSALVIAVQLAWYISLIVRYERSIAAR